MEEWGVKEGDFRSPEDRAKFIRKVLDGNANISSRHLKPEVGARMDGLRKRRDKITKFMTDLAEEGIDFADGSYERMMKMTAQELRTAKKEATAHARAAGSDKTFYIKGGKGGAAHRSVRHASADGDE